MAYHTDAPYGSQTEQRTIPVMSQVNTTQYFVTECASMHVLVALADKIIFPKRADDSQYHSQ